MQGGTSWFVSRDRIVGGMLGAVVIASVANGLDLLDQSAAESAVWAGAVN
jgi:ABC-type xylose transport system permease subunit